MTNKYGLSDEDMGLLEKNLPEVDDEYLEGLIKHVKDPSLWKPHTGFASIKDYDSSNTFKLKHCVTVDVSTLAYLAIDMDMIDEAKEIIRLARKLEPLIRMVVKVRSLKEDQEHENKS